MKAHEIAALMESNSNKERQFEEQRRMTEMLRNEATLPQRINPSLFISIS